MQTKLTYTILSLLFGVMGWVWITSFDKLTEIEKSLIEVKLELVKIQATMIDREEVIRIVNEQIERRVK